MNSFNYQEVQPERDITGDNFANGQINFNFTLDNAAYWNPYRSFLKIRCKIYKRVSGANNQLVKSC